MTMKLLIVDDSEPIRASLRGLLGCVAGITRIEEASTLAEAVQYVQRDAPQLVILDLHLPDGLATQVIGTLKQMAPHMAIAVLTLHAEQSYRQRCLALGADWFFDKTREIEELVTVVRQHAALN